MQILYALAEPGRHRTPPDDNLDNTDGQHECRGDERSHRPGESWSSTGERREHHDCDSSGNDRNDGTHCADLRQSEMRRHTGSNRRLCGGTVRSDLPRRVLIIAHGGQHRCVGVSCERRESRPAAWSQAGARKRQPQRAERAMCTERAEAFFLCERRRRRRIQSALRIARRCPGRTNEQTRFSSARERGRQRLASAILASGASNQASCEQLQNGAASVGNRAPAAWSQAGAPLSWTIERADTSFVCERVRKAAARKRQPQRAERAMCTEERAEAFFLCERRRRRRIQARDARAAQKRG